MVQCGHTVKCRLICSPGNGGISFMNLAVKSGRVASVVLGAAFLLSLLTSLCIGEQLMSVRFIAIVIDDIGKIVPAVNKIGYETIYASAARVTIALQWIFAPIYFVLFIAQSPPWGNFVFKSPRRNVRIKGVIGSILICALSLFIVLSDLWSTDASIIRGGLFDPSFGPFWLRLPFEGRFFLAIGATLMPLINAFSYYYVTFCIGMFSMFAMRNIKRKM